MVVWSEGPSTLRSAAKLCKHALSGRRLKKGNWCTADLVAGDARGSGGARCRDPYEQDGFHRPQKDDKEREESRWMQSVRDYTVLLIPHPLSSGTRTAKHTWAFCSPQSRPHHERLGALRSGQVASLTLQKQRTCFWICYGLDNIFAHGAVLQREDGAY